MALHRCVLALLLGLGGCVDADPANQAGRWTPAGVNARNIAAMAVSPRDLIRGRGETGSDGLMAAASVRRLQQGRTKPLLSINADAAPGGAAAPAGAAAEPAP